MYDPLHIMVVVLFTFVWLRALVLLQASEKLSFQAVTFGIALFAGMVSAVPAVILPLLRSVFLTDGASIPLVLFTLFAGAVQEGLRVTLIFLTVRKTGGLSSRKTAMITGGAAGAGFAVLENLALSLQMDVTGTMYRSVFPMGAHILFGALCGFFFSAMYTKQNTSFNRQYRAFMILVPVALVHGLVSGFAQRSGFSFGVQISSYAIYIALLAGITLAAWKSEDIREKDPTSGAFQSATFIISPHAGNSGSIKQKRGFAHYLLTDGQYMDAARLFGECKIEDRDNRQLYAIFEGASLIGAGKYVQGVEKVRGVRSTISSDERFQLIREIKKLCLPGIITIPVLEILESSVYGTVDQRQDVRVKSGLQYRAV